MVAESPGVLDVVVVGGGIAGLAAAYELSRRGLSFAVLESAPRPGGVILSEQIEGFTLDGGPDALLVQKPDGIALCEELGLGGQLISTRPPRLAYVQRGGRLHALPAASVLGIPTAWGPFVRTSLFSWTGKLRMGAELFVPRKIDDADESIGSFITRRFGREATEYLAEPLLAGIHAGDVDRLSVQSLFPRFVAAERTHGSLLRAFRHSRRSPDRGGGAGPADTNGAFRSLPGGLSDLVCALVRRLGKPNVRVASQVIGLTGDQPYEVRVASGHRVHGRAVVLATPTYVTAALMRDCDDRLARLCGEIDYTSVATVALGFHREMVAHPLNGSGFVVPRAENTGILAASWLSSKWPGRAPDDRALLRTFLGGARDPGALDCSDQELISRSLKATRSILGISGDPILTRVFRWKRASAQHDVGHLARVAAVDRALAQHPGLFFTGSGLRGTGIPDCVADGRATARAAAEWLSR
jgi:oxygen-dependent protoporphyrinogen oxidase